MNRIERSFAFGQEAKIRYLDGEFQVLKNGAYVRCAVTGEPIRIEELRYWSVPLPGALCERANLTPPSSGEGAAK